MASHDFDPSDYVEDVKDYVLIDEFMRRARYEFERGRYDEMMIYLERSLGWSGLGNLKVTK